MEMTPLIATPIGVTLITIKEALNTQLKRNTNYLGSSIISIINIGFDNNLIASSIVLFHKNKNKKTKKKWSCSVALILHVTTSTCYTFFDIDT